MTFDYPLQMNMEKRDCLIVGAGKVALRKAHRLLDAGAMVTMIAPECKEIVEDNICLLQRSFQPDDVRGRFLVFAATDDPVLNNEICRCARKAGALANSATGKESSDFILPSVIHKASMQISISTDGVAPIYARMMREYLEEILDQRFLDALWVMGEVRKEILAMENLEQPEREKRLRQINFKHLLTDLANMSKEELLRKVTACLLS